MTRRQRTDQQAAGDDSFLDIIANIVGILIILIVVAGVRASRAPVDLPQRVIEPALETIAEADALEPPPTGVVEPETDPRPRATAPAVVDRTDEVTELVDQVAVLGEQLGDTVERLRAVRGDLSVRQADLQRLRGRGAVRDSEVERLGAEVDRSHAGVVALEASDQAARRKLKTLLTTPTSSVVEVRHRLTPVGRVVRGGEQHFHVRGGRVARIPLESLKRRVRDQLARYGRVMSRYSRHEGVVGPVDGFVMEYTVERQPVRLVDELRHGRGMVRIAVTHWTIRPEPELESELIGRALSSGSRYQTVLRTSDPGTPLTFWVYPDSFSGLRRLQSAAHRAGFRVAARPLPVGVTISGSPQGSRSQAQ